MTSVIRYMDFAKFLYLLETRSIYFCRADLLEDKNECLPHTKEDIVLTDKMISTWHKLSEVKSMDGGASQMKLENELSSGDVMTKFVCSWSKGNLENYALWKIYCNSGIGVAIKSSVERVEKSLKIPDDFSSEFFHGEIHYGGPKEGCDYTMRKMHAFSFESEYRFIFNFDYDDSEIAKIMPKKDGFSIPVELEILIEEIIISPFNNILSENLIKDFLKKYKLDAKVSKSYLGV